MCLSSKFNYQDFNDFYKLRSKVIGIENAKNSFPFWLLKKFVKKNWQIVEVGCGRGRLLYPLSLISGFTRGYDISSENVMLCKNHGLQVSECDCVESIPELKNSIDLFICAEVLEHLHDDDRASLLSNIYNCLKINGLIYISIPYKEHYDSNLCICPNCKTQFHRFGHVGVIKEDDILREIEKAGFQVTKSIVEYPNLAPYRVPFIVWYFFGKYRLNKPGNLIVIAKKAS